MNEYEELIKTAKLLKTVSVNGDYWMLMQACVNSIIAVAEAIKARGDSVDTIDNNA